MAWTVFHRERSSSSTPRSFVDATTPATVDFGSAPVGVVVVLHSPSSPFDDFTGVRIGGTAGDFTDAGWNSASFNVPEVSPPAAGLNSRVFAYFGAGIPTGAQPVHYTKSSTNNGVFATIFVFDGAETGIANIQFSSGSTSGGVFSITHTGTTAGRTVLAGGFHDGSSTSAGSGTTLVMNQGGTFAPRGFAFSRSAGSPDTVLNGNASGATAWRAVEFEVIATSAPAFSANPGNTTVTQPATATFSATYSGTITAYQWQVSTDGGTSWGSVPDGTGASGGSGTGATLTYTTTATAVSTGNHRNGYRYRLRLTHSGGTVDSTAGILTVNAPDTTAPTLTSPTGSGGLSVCSGTVGTNEGNGTLYAVATASSTQPTALQVRNGQDHTGAPALRAVSQAVSATGTQTVASGAISGGAGTRFLHYMHEDAAGNRSAVVSSAGFSVSANATQLVVTVADAAGVTGVNGVVLSAAAPGAGVSVIQTVTGASFNGSGQLTITITGLGVPTGAYRYVVLSRSDGTPGQSPAPFCAQGPVIAS